MKRLIFILVLVFYIPGWAGNVYNIPPDIYAHAFQKSIKASGVDKSLTTHHFPIIWEYEYIIETDTNGVSERVFGYYTRALWFGRKGRLKTSERIRILISKLEHYQCPGFLEEILIHELMHAWYLRRVITEEGFQEENPDEHIWISNSYKFQAPCWWGETEDIQIHSESTCKTE